MLGDSLLICKQIFYRELVCLIVITVLYIAVLINKIE